MRFEFEKVTDQLLARRIYAEEDKAGREVTKVFLSPPEWAEWKSQRSSYPEDIFTQDSKTTIGLALLRRHWRDFRPGVSPTQHVDIILDRK